MTIDFGIVKFIKKFIERFFEKCEICSRGPKKLRAKTVTKVAECRLIKFFLLAIAQSSAPPFLYARISVESNHYEMKPRLQSLSFSLKCYFTVFTVFTVFINFAIIEAIMVGTNSLKRFLKKTPGTEKHEDI